MMIKNNLGLRLDGLVFGNGTLSHIQCMQSMQQGIDKWCGIEAYHVVKCEYSQTAVGMYQGLSFASQFQQPTTAP